MNAGDALILRGDARTLPLPDDSVDLIVTSPPYFALRSYEDEGEHYDGQVGSEPTPRDFLEALWACMGEAVRVLKPGGSIFVNLGDKYAGAGGHNNAAIGGRGRGPKRYTKNVDVRADLIGKRREDARAQSTRGEGSGGIRSKSLMGLPWRFALGCIDDLGLILREELIWSKPNGIPESVKDRTARSHEQWFHFVKEGRYFAAVDDLRTPHARTWGDGENGGRGQGPDLTGNLDVAAAHPLGALPKSVWEIATEPLRIPEYAIEDDRGWRMFGKPCINEQQRQRARAALWEYAERRHREGLGFLRIFEPDHFAAFPSEWPRRVILGWSPSAICTACGEGRRPIVHVPHAADHDVKAKASDKQDAADIRDASQRSQIRMSGSAVQKFRAENPNTLLGYACACTPYTDHPPKAKGVTTKQGRGAGPSDPREGYEGTLGKRPKVGGRREFHFDGWEPPATRPAVVLDIFGGTGTTAMVARALGRFGISVDLSADYCRLARWRVFESGDAKKAIGRTAKERQGALSV